MKGAQVRKETPVKTISNLIESLNLSYICVTPGCHVTFKQFR